MGLAPKGTKVGDFICIVKPARTPLVLQHEGERGWNDGECAILCAIR